MVVARHVTKLRFLCPSGLHTTAHHDDDNAAAAHHYEQAVFKSVSMKPFSLPFHDSLSAQSQLRGLLGRDCQWFVASLHRVHCIGGGVVEAGTVLASSATCLRLCHALRFPLPFLRTVRSACCTCVPVCLSLPLPSCSAWCCLHLHICVLA